MVVLDDIRSLRTEPDRKDLALAQGRTHGGQGGVDFGVGEVIRLSMPVDRHWMSDPSVILVEVPEEGPFDETELARAADGSVLFLLTKDSPQSECRLTPPAIAEIER